MKKICLFIKFRINRENIYYHTFCLTKFKGLEKERYFNELLKEVCANGKKQTITEELSFCLPLPVSAVL